MAFQKKKKCRDFVHQLRNGIYEKTTNNTLLLRRRKIQPNTNRTEPIDVCCCLVFLFFPFFYFFFLAAFSFINEIPIALIRPLKLITKGRRKKIGKKKYCGQLRLWWDANRATTAKSLFLSVISVLGPYVEKHCCTAVMDECRGLVGLHKDKYETTNRYKMQRKQVFFLFAVALLSFLAN